MKLISICLFCHNIVCNIHANPTCYHRQFRIIYSVDIAQNNTNSLKEIMNSWEYEQKLEYEQSWKRVRVRNEQSQKCQLDA